MLAGAAYIGTGCSSETTPAGTGSGTGGSTEGSTESEACQFVHDGDLRIDQTTELESLSQVRSIGGNLRIIGVSSPDLQFLGCLEEVLGDVEVMMNPVLETLDGAGRLASIGFDETPGLAGGSFGSLRVVGNPALQSLDGLTGLEHVHGSLSISDNDALATIGLPQLQRIEAGLAMGGCSSPGPGFPATGSGSNPLLTGFDGLDSLQYVGGVSIYGQQSLTSLGRLRELADGGAEFGSVVEIGINPSLSASEIGTFVDAAGATTIVACQNKDDEELCFCPSD